MPYILYSLGAHRAKYLSRCHVTLLGYAKSEELRCRRCGRDFSHLGVLGDEGAKNIYPTINKHLTKRTYTNLYKLIIKS